MSKQGENLVSNLVDELNELGLPNMVATLDTLYHSSGFLQMDRLSLISELIAAEYQDKISKRYNNRLRHAKLVGCPCEINACSDSGVREYLPNGITEVLSSTAFIKDGLNVCILGPSDSGKTYLAKALGIAACHNYKTEYHHCEMFLEDLVALNAQNHNKFLRRLKLISKLDLLILDDFLCTQSFMRVKSKCYSWFWRLGVNLKRALLFALRGSLKAGHP